MFCEILPIRNNILKFESDPSTGFQVIARKRQSAARPPAVHHHFNNRIFPSQNPVKNLFCHAFVYAIFLGRGNYFRVGMVWGNMIF
jgi:hypothetical protein